MSEPPRAIFLSYASQDTDAARRICEALREAGLEVWFDQSELRGGDAWDASIRKQIKECALFVPIVSVNTNARSEGYFRLEWKLAVDRSHLMADDQLFLLPVVIDATSEPDARVPDRFRERQWSRAGDEASAAAFARRMRQLLAGDTPSAASSARPSPAKVRAASKPPPATRKGKQGILWAALGAVVLAAGGAIAWAVVEQQRKASFIAESVPRIELLAREQKFVQAFRLAREVEQAGGGAAISNAGWENFTRRIDITSEPAGVEISLRPFATEEAWVPIGKTPLEKLRVPRGPQSWRAQLPGHQAAEQVFTPYSDAKLKLTMRPGDAKDADMVLVNGGEVDLWSIGAVSVEPKVPLEPFLIDRREVTNAQYARFVKDGGYTKPEYWKHEFRDGARVLSFADALARFRDSTGRPGPATWRVGSFPDSEEEMPVRGIGWYEAAAYAAFAGKELPTVYHWYWADTAGDIQLLPGLVLPSSNYEGKGPRKASESKALSAFGALDMAGNVREWAAGLTQDGRRIALGGAWNDPAYLYLFPDPRSAFDRAPENGVRCIKRLGDAPLNERATRALGLAPKRVVAKPPSDAEYRTFTRFYERAKVPLEPRIDATDDSSPHWTKQTVSFAAGYGGERMIAYLYLPKNAKPPFQVAIQMAGSGTFYRRTSKTEADFFGWGFAEPLLRGGRAVLLPLWKGSYERSDGFNPLESDIATYRGQVIKWVHELHQSIDYLESRPDIDPTRVAWQGISFGSSWAPVFMALEPRLKNGIWLLGGLVVTARKTGTFPPEIDAATYAPRVKAPVLMLNGRHDAIFPYESSQVPLFDLLGTPKDQKRHVTFPAGHSSFGWNDGLIRESLDWLDRHFGAPTGLAPRGIAKS